MITGDLGPDIQSLGSSRVEGVQTSSTCLLIHSFIHLIIRSLDRNR